MRDSGGGFELPDGARGHVHPRRGGRTGVDAAPLRGAAADRVDVRAELSEGSRAALTGVGDGDDSARRPVGSLPHLVRAAEAHLDGSPTPLGAAAVLRLLANQEHPRVPRLVDAWVEAHDLVFAARAIAGLARVEAVHCPAPSGGHGWHLRELRPGSCAIRWQERDLALRARTLLAACPDAVHAEVVAALAGSRDTPQGRLLVSYLVPTEREWAEEVVAEVLRGPRDSADSDPVLAALGTADQLTRLLGLDWVVRRLPTPEFLWTALDVLGHDLLPALDRLLGTPELPEPARDLVAEVLAVLPGDDAFAVLLPRLGQREVRPLARAVAGRDPERALRLLAAEAEIGPATSDAAIVLRSLVVGLADLDVRDLPEAAGAVLARERAARRAAPAEGLPPVLTSPPWARERREAEAPVVVAGLEPLVRPHLRWEPGEREGWLAKQPRTGPDPADWTALADACADGRPTNHGSVLFARAPEELVRPLLARWNPEPWAAEQWGRPVVARFGLDVLPRVLALGQVRPTSLGGLLAPFATPEVAGVMADWLSRFKHARPIARGWLERHGVDAARLLAPVAVGPAGTERRAAEHALRQIPEHALTAAREHGERVAAIVAASLALDPLDVLPVRVPAVPAWLEPDLLPQVLRDGGRTALPEGAVRHLLVVLALSTPEDPHAGLEQAREACDPASLARFAWAVFDQWRMAGAPHPDRWALTCLALVGDDQVVRALGPLLAAWPVGSAKADVGLAVLARIGTDVALTCLDDASRRLRNKWLRGRARQELDGVATARGLSAEELSDRLVPDFGLSPDGALELDFGPRRFVVGFDEQLRPHVTGPDGKRLKSLPKPGARDDAALAARAHERFAALKRDLRTSAAEQLTRLERAMVAGRTWGVEEFTRLFTGHPLLWPLGRRLVWTTEAGLAFRLAEDRTLGDLHESPVVLGPDERVAIAHPLRLGADLAAWAELLADYEVLQPFPQLGRAVHRLTAEEGGADELARFRDFPVLNGKVVALLDRGPWSQAGGLGGPIGRVRRALPDGRGVVVGLDPALPRGRVPVGTGQRITEVRIAERGPFGTADPVVVSEVVEDLLGLAR
ncbi:DUF4132 domain-containing protein [Actinosynnema mirum]|uniref:WGR domain-containing protein n=1 Tax=Actinosynnema mirum (strain ATCC 29888 / DSM 43827 / JCM 3225 / NBRC 14064 / NCIMB 13271 / NRRL B-12336 / IMRU 3971 / 101) TaxID=446462 RepID=C6WE94_ACTMD|nr:DUF4132 domain-containing protein [Actinosynnema mirum]ACU35837.1 WGR domain-containing protein [Actinosynnema mirum DSM 43827]